MTTTNFMIGPIKDALRKDIKPFAIPEDAFETIVNAYQFRGRVVRRQGYTLLGRLDNNTPVMGLKTRELFGLSLQELIAFDTTQTYFFDSGTNSFLPLPSIMPVVWSGTDSQFFFTTNYAGAFWATNFKPGLNGWIISNFAGSAGVGATATVKVTSAGNAVAFNDFVYFINLDAAVSGNAAVLAQVTVAGDPFTVKAINVPATFTWTDGATSHGMVLDSMQTIVGQDGIRYYGVLTNGTGWANYNPPIDLNNALAGALLIFPYRGYLVFLNTWEGNDQNVFNFGNRARWTQIGTPYYSEPVPTTPNPQTFDIKTARDDLFGRGGANDAPTNEVIIGADFIRDILVVYFERSTWRLRFVNNAQNPFVWERVNKELGSSCTNSTIPFDKGLMAISNRGIVISDGNDTVRFDEKIPDDIFNIRQNNDGLERVNGIRTFRTKLNFWTIPSAANPNGIYPDQVLVFNYETKNWSYFDDCFTCFGYFYPSNAGKRWVDLPDPWPSYDNITALDGVSQEGYETIVAGNQQGFVFKLEQTTPKNDVSLFISNIVGSTVTSPNHNLPEGTWITITGVLGTTGSDGVSLNNRNYKITNPSVDANNFIIQEYESVDGGLASGAIYLYTIDFVPILAGSVQIDVGTLEFVDSDLDGVLFVSGVPLGTIDYNSGTIVLNFSPPIAPTEVIIRVVSLNPEQNIVVVPTTGAYGGEGLIAKISNIDIQTKFFNFFGDDKRSRLSKIDFYTNLTSKGQFICNVFGDSSNQVINSPLPDNPQSNVVLTTTSPFQVGQGDETIFRLYCDSWAQTVQLQLTLSDQQMAVNRISQENIELLALMFTLKRGGRLP